MRLLISLSALLLSTLFVQMGIGSLRPFDAISGQALGFTSVEIGFLASGHSPDFFSDASSAHTLYAVPAIRVLLPSWRARR